MNFGILITNPNHHVELTLPVALELKKEGHKVKYISLCELRRMKTPTGLFEEQGFEFIQMKALAEDLKPSTGSKSLGDNNSIKRKLLRSAFWQLKLKGFCTNAFKGLDRVLLMNDTAFPGDRITSFLHRKRIPLYLLQEGIRFPLPTEMSSQYGGAGAKMVFAWGEKSMNHFNTVKRTNTQVIAAGSPRIDSQFRLFSRPVNIEGVKTLGLFSNPIDDQGFCSPEIKMDMVVTFFQKIAPTLNKNGIRVIIKTHPRENPVTYYDALKELVTRIEIADIPINEAIEEVQAGLIMASTVGLELLMAGKNLIQLEIPEYGYVFDYVSEGVAMKAGEMRGEELLLAFNNQPNAHNTYLSKHFANLGRSAEEIAKGLLV